MEKAVLELVDDGDISKKEYKYALKNDVLTGLLMKNGWFVYEMSEKEAINETA